ncbi:MAG: GDSL-type esterase/lipase family protein [Cytophagales bacterium]|nr:GDSL-type esterase/lipase family protein [Cytophagales bacterium]
MVKVYTGKAPMNPTHLLQNIHRPMILVCIVHFLLLAGCSEEETSKPVSDSINKIMPLGASRVEGDRPEYESFRFELWLLLTDGNWDFDYMGTRTDGGSYPAIRDKPSFDRNHEGRGGWTSGDILEGIDGWLAETGAPDIVLFSSPGGNDALLGLDYDQAVSNINAIIDAIQVVNPEVTIIIEQLAPGHSEIMTGELLMYFDQIQRDLPQLAQEQTTDTSQVIVVDMFTGFTDDLLADDVHYNTAGAKFIAQRYYAMLESVLK